MRKTITSKYSRVIASRVPYHSSQTKPETRVQAEDPRISASLRDKTASTYTHPSNRQDDDRYEAGSHLLPTHFSHSRTGLERFLQSKLGQNYRGKKQ